MRDLNNLQPKHHSIIHSCLHGITQTLAKKSKPYKTTYTRLSKRIEIVCYQNTQQIYMFA